MLLHRALVGGPDDGRFVFLREFWGQLDVEQHFADHAIQRIGLERLDDADPLCWNAALLAETKDVNAGASANGG